jgi:hypothetical protein
MWVQKSIDDLKKSVDEMPEGESVLSAKDFFVFLGILSSGLVLTMSSLFIAITKGYDLFEILVPVKFEIVRNVGFFLSLTQEYACITGIYIGSLFILGPIFLFSFRKTRSGFFATAIKMIGFFFGFCITYFLIYYFFSDSFIYQYSPSLFVVKLYATYVVFAFFDRLKSFIKGTEISRYKFEILADGMFTLCSLPILLRGYESEMSSYFTGPLFLASFFIGLHVAEKVTIRLMILNALTESPVMDQMIESNQEVIKMKDSGGIKTFRDVCRVPVILFKIWKQQFNEVNYNHLLEIESIYNDAFEKMENSSDTFHRIVAEISKDKKSFLYEALIPFTKSFSSVFIYTLGILYLLRIYPALVFFMVV